MTGSTWDQIVPAHCTEPGQGVNERQIVGWNRAEVAAVVCWFLRGFVLLRRVTCFLLASLG